MNLLHPYFEMLPAPLNHPYTLVALLVGSYVVKWAYQYVQVRIQVLGLPTTHSWIELFESGFRSKLPNIPFLVPNAALTLDKPWEKYTRAKTDLLAYTQVSTPGYAVYATSSPEVAAMISNKTATYLKPTQMFRYQAINIFGLQIVSTQTGAEHKRHKNVVKGCFNEAVMRNAWNQTVEAWKVLVKEEGLEHGGVIKDVKVAMVKMTLLVFGLAAFGVEFPWNFPKTDGDVLPLGEALEIVEMSMIPQLLLPLWFMKYSPSSYLRRLAKAQTSLVLNIKQMIASRRETIAAQRDAHGTDEKVPAQQDILGALVATQMQVEDEARLTGQKGAGLRPDEVFGNAWIFIVAGHETSGHTLTFSLALLALHPECQDEIVAEVDRVTGGETPSYENMSQFEYTLAVVYETLRLRDEVMFIPKLTSEDTWIPYTTWDNQGNVTRHSRFIKAGSHVLIDSPACQINPFYWDNPEGFDPKRHLGEEGKNTKNGFTGFSMGQRVCIGKRFAEVESVAFLVMMMSNYKILPKPVKEGETMDEMKERLFKGTEELNLMPGKFSLFFEPRTGEAEKV